MKRWLPPTGALQAFEAAARHASFTLAAAELNVTQSAISRAIRELETELGVPLFRRHRQRVFLSEQGETYALEVRDLMSRLEAATLELRSRRNEEGVLNLAVMPTFGGKWLIPRIPDFMQKYPDVRLNFLSETTAVDFSAREVDAAIQYGRPIWPDLSVDRLIGEELVPVCNPAILNGPRRPRMPIDLVRHPLLHLNSIPGAWKTWFSAAGAGEVILRPLPAFEHFAMCIQAAIAGVGVALMPHFLVCDDIRGGRLAVPFPISVKSDLAYYFVCPRRKERFPPVGLFRKWILQMAEVSERECAGLLG